jgi:tetratricopeptide (TPR) repeat protein
MRQILLIFGVLLFTGIACAQSWRDSLALGKKQYQEGKYDKAYESLIEAQKLAPEGVDLSKDIGNAAYRNGDYEMAEKAFRSVASNTPDPQQSSKHWHNVGNSQLQRKDYQQAIESYKQALRENPDNENARYNLAEAKRRLKKQQEQQKKQQEKNQDQNKNENENQEKGQDKQGDKSQGDQQNKSDQEKKGEQSENGENQKGSGEKQQAEKLSSKKTERLLDELMKKEMRTKRKAVGTQSSSSKEVKSGKKW